MRMKRFHIKRPLALFVCLCIAAAFLLSAWFIISHADHDCIGEHCPVCVQMCAAEKLLKQLSGAGADVLAAFSAFLAVFVVVCPAYVDRTSPVTLKVRMNN